MHYGVTINTLDTCGGDAVMLGNGDARSQRQVMLGDGDAVMLGKKSWEHSNHVKYVTSFQKNIYTTSHT